jgi:hypothetical protein
MQTDPKHPMRRRVDPHELDRHIAEMYRDVAKGAVRDLHFPTGRGLAEALGYLEAAPVLRPGGQLALADIVTERQIAKRTSWQADLWAACIAGASQSELYLDDIAAAGLELQVVQDNPGYRFTSGRAERTSARYGAQSRSLLALKPIRAFRHTSHPDLGGGADVAQAASEEGSTHTTATQEVSQ